MVIERLPPQTVEKGLEGVLADHRDGNCVGLVCGIKTKDGKVRLYMAGDEEYCLLLATTLSADCMEAFRAGGKTSGIS